MTKQAIPASALEADGFAALIADHNAAIEVERQKGAALAAAFRIWVGAKGLPTETRLVGVGDGVIDVDAPEPVETPA